ncbi:MAG: DUF3883 domain-containing protein, partial [Prosthecobacter sp.]|nr:DUF3883 domain-containing protein [Prosthecobacter sp.]
LARAIDADAAAHRELDAWLGTRRMAKLLPGELDQILAAAKLVDVHPLNGINLQNELEDAAQGGLGATKRLSQRAATRKISKIELKAARIQADETGTIGEEFVNEWLTGECQAGQFKSFEWTSRDNAIAPFDFTISSLADEIERLDVKATSGKFRNALHMSINELLHCADTHVPYRIYRVFAINGRRAKLRISAPLGSFAETIVPLLEQLPAGVSADGISIDPAKLEFDQEICLELRPDSDD